MNCKWLFILGLSCASAAQAEDWHAGLDVGAYTLRQDIKANTTLPNEQTSYQTLTPQLLYRHDEPLWQQTVQLNGTYGLYQDQKYLMDGNVAAATTYQGQNTYSRSEVLYKASDDERGMLRLSLQDQFEAQNYSAYQRRFARTWEGSQLMSWDMTQRISSEFFLWAQAVDRGVFIKSLLAQAKISYLLHGPWVVGLSGDAYWQRFDRADSRSHEPRVFLTYLAPLKGKFTLAVGQGRATALGATKQVSSYNVAWEQKLETWRVLASYGKKVGAAANAQGTAVTEGFEAKAKWLSSRHHHYELATSATDEESAASTVAAKRRRIYGECAYLFQMGRLIAWSEEEDVAEQEVALRYRNEQLSVKHGMKAYQYIVSISWSRRL